jgi:signal transduction histidine kinase
LSAAVHNVYMLHRLQSRTAAIERANLARELHDGLIQSLIAAEIIAHSARRRVGTTSMIAAAELARVQDVLHQEVLGARDLMQRIKPLHVEPEDLLDFVAERVRKFESDSGIKAAFITNVHHAALPSRTCTELVRIVQEALSNVRKHSGALTVSVCLQEEATYWSLVVKDDGRGMEGLGAESQEQGARREGPPARAFRPLIGQSGPMVIRECVRLIGGELVVRSERGLCLEITIPSAKPPSYISQPSDTLPFSVSARERRAAALRSARRLLMSNRAASLRRVTT